MANIEKPIFDSCDFTGTITLHPRMYRFRPEEQHEKASLIIDEVFKDTFYSCVMELTKSMNIHYHIMFKFNRQFYSIMDFYNAFRKRNGTTGFVKFEQLEDFNLWTDYMYKDITKTYTALDKKINPMIRDDYLISKDRPNGRTEQTQALISKDRPNGRTEQTQALISKDRPNGRTEQTQVFDPEEYSDSDGSFASMDSPAGESFIGAPMNIIPKNLCAAPQAKSLKSQSAFKSIAPIENKNNLFRTIQLKRK
jgi:hypothetical protein